MLHYPALTLLFFSLVIPAQALASSELTILEEVVARREQVQPELRNYVVNVETSRIEQMMSNLTSDIPAGVIPPPRPVITKVWQRKGPGLVFADPSQLTPYVEKMVKRLSGNLVVELDKMLIPDDQAGQRALLVKDAQLKSSEVILAESHIHQLQITFNQPTDLDGAFYVSGMRLPQKQITALNFDIDSKAGVIREMELVTADGLRLDMEVRYRAVTGGHIPERFRITSPDGKIDDLFEVKFTDIQGFILPESMLRDLRRPDLEEQLEVFFRNYRVNQPITDEIRQQLEKP